MATSRSSSSLLAGTSKESGPPFAGRTAFRARPVKSEDAWPEPTRLLGPLPAWFKAQRRDLPWRAVDLEAPHPDPYAVLVSEMMLQQTQVATVKPYFLRWMQAFPDAPALARASEDDLHRHWQGLGYYRRARNLQGAARSIAVSGWPRSLQGLQVLPGLGPYSAAAVAAIAFQLPEPALDGNALRVAARLLALEDPQSCRAQLRDWLRPALAQLGPSLLTQGVMELGALVCLPRRPRCGACPLAPGCRAAQEVRTESCPAPRPRPAPRTVDLWLVALEGPQGWLLERPAQRGLLAGLWRWPAPARPESQLEDSPAWVQTYTHRRERIFPRRLKAAAPFEAGPGRAWIDGTELPFLPMGRRDQRLRTLVLAGSLQESSRSEGPLDLVALLRA